MQRFLSFSLLLVFAFCSFSCNKSNKSETDEVKNIILLIGDGMGVAQVYAAMSVANEKLNFERSQYIGFSKTYSASSYTTDSGAGATAIATGKKVSNGVISVDVSGEKLIPITSIAQKAGLSTGIVALCNLYHATPACFAVGDISRYNYNRITQSFSQTNIDVLIGGGAHLFDSLGVIDSLKNHGYDFHSNLNSIDIDSDSPVLCLPYSSHPPNILKGRSESFLSSAVQVAVEKLKKNKKGFFLMVEGSQIDWGGHKNDIDYIVTEMLDFDKAIGEAYNFADDNPGTLVIVTADHETGGLSIPMGSIEDKTIVANFATNGHSGIMVPIFAYGTGANEFSTVMENTDIFVKMMSALKLKQ